jgi:DNA-binding HxlR family transcriptional regulator
VLGRRWALRVLWETTDAPLTYRELAAGIPGMSTSVLTDRLRELRAAGLVEHTHGAGYRLTPLGHGLRTHLEGLRNWAQQVDFNAEPSA